MDGHNVRKKGSPPTMTSDGHVLDKHESLLISLSSFYDDESHMISEREYITVRRR